MHGTESTQVTCKLRLSAAKKASYGPRGRAVCSSVESASCGAGVGWGGISGSHQGRMRVYQANRDSDMARCREGSTQEGWHLPIGQFNTETTVAVPLALTLYVSGTSSVTIPPPEPRVSA